MALSKKDLLSHNGHPALLDRLAIATPRGQLAAMFGLGAELYVGPNDRTQLRQDMLDVQEDYYLRFKDYLDRCRFPSKNKPDGQIITLKGDTPFPTIRDSMGEWPSDQGYSNELFKRYVHPDFPGDAGTVTPWMSEFLVAAEIADELSFYGFHLPVDGGQNGPNFDRLLECTLAWATRLKPTHGQAGFSVILEIGSLWSQPYVHATLQRHPGLDIHVPAAFIRQSRGVFNRLKCVNWLTILGDSILDELGGLDVARAALEPDCTLHSYAGGLLIQAGPLPQLGDTHHELVPERYRKVARFTAPARFEAYRSSLFRVFKPLVGREEAIKWVRRFD